MPARRDMFAEENERVALSNSARTAVEKRLKHLESVKDRVVIDADAHPSDPGLYPADVAARVAVGPNYYHGRPITGNELIAEMDQSEVDMALCWQNPAVTRYDDDTSVNFAALRKANAYIAAFADANPTRIIPAGWTDPKALDLNNALEMARLCVEEWGFPVVKMNPAQNAYPIDSDMVMEVVDRIVSLGAIPAFHFGSDTPFTPPEGLERVALRHPAHPIIAVHMGGGGGHFVEAEKTYLAARDIGLRLPNIFYILSAKRDTHIESDLITYAAAGEPYRSNMAVASDVPYGRIAWNFGAFRGLFATLADGKAHNDPRLKVNPGLFDPTTIQRFMGGNLAALVIEAYRRLLG